MVDEADDSGFKPSGGTWGMQMKRLSDFEILRKEHDILARKLDRIVLEQKTIIRKINAGRGDIDRIEKLLEQGVLVEPLKEAVLLFKQQD